LAVVVAVVMEPFGDAVTAPLASFAEAAVVDLGDDAARALVTGLLEVIAGAGDVGAGDAAMVFSGNSVVFCATGTPDVSILLGGSGFAGEIGDGSIVDGAAVPGPVFAGSSALAAATTGASPFA
jgi:hypothetical protein